MLRKYYVTIVFTEFKNISNAIQVNSIKHILVL
jgi:hypothetical protein